MATDLVDSKVLIGKNKSQVIELLGQAKDSSKTNLLYLVDFGYMVPFHLNINFDNEGLKVLNTDLSD